MNRPAPSLSLALAVLSGAVAAFAVLAFASSRSSSAEDPVRPHHIVYLHVSGEGPQSKAWYDGGPPSGTSVQSALNHFATQGYRFAAIASSGNASITHVSGASPTPSATDPRAPEPFFVVLLER